MANSSNEESKIVLVQERPFSWLLQPFPLMVGFFIVLFLIGRVIACNRSKKVLQETTAANAEIDSAKIYREQAEKTKAFLIWQDSVNQKDKQKIAELAAKRAEADLRAMETERQSEIILRNANKDFNDFKDSLKKPHNALTTARNAMRDIYGIMSNE